MADATMLARRQLRLAALAALTGDQFAGITIESPGDWSTPPDAMPAILLRAADERKESIAKGPPQFTSTIGIEIEARVSGKTAAAAQDSIEALCYTIEMALLTNYDLMRLVSQVASVDSRTEVTSEGRIHFGGARMLFSYEVPEMFDTFITGQPVPLASFGLHFDAGAPFDATGVYENPLFPGNTAPRTAGPDGRDEGALDITLPQ